MFNGSRNGPGRGKGRGLGRGRGRGQGRYGEAEDFGHRGEGKCGKGMGPEGFCICKKCGTEVPHTPGVSCVEVKCPKCGFRMIRKGL